MPRTPKSWLTKEQREERERQEREERNQKTYRKFSNDLNGFMRDSRMTQKQLAELLGIGCCQAGKLLNAKHVQVDVFIILEALHLAGFQVIRKDP